VSHSQSDYLAERDLVDDFARWLRDGSTCWGEVRIGFEFDYHGGWTDVVALCGAGGELVAFEAKLAKWREALHQAYRCLCFAERAYVVLPTEAAQVAVRHVQEFRRRRVGLCSMSAGRGIEVLLDVEPGTPLQPWVAARARQALSSETEATRGCQPMQTSCESRKRSRR
jgi:hypothetical protein